MLSRAACAGLIKKLTLYLRLPQDAGQFRGNDRRIQTAAQVGAHRDVGAQPKHAETTGWIDGGLAVADLAALVTQHYEVPVGQPAQQRGDIPAVRAGEPALGVGVEFGRQADQHGRHRRGVQRHLTRLGENTRQEALDLIHRLGVDRLGELHVDPCLVDAIAEWRIGRRDARAARG